ncbi:MAG: hypothetical protein Q8J88_01215 [Bacteroidales bacterium]|nr:hypothetical protein [Bacteroidales bacterium]
MKPRQIHNKAMEFSFKAREALDEGDTERAKKYYLEASILETELADFYKDKPDLEPTRSAIFRSAVFLNLKAGRVLEAQNLIYFGLLYLDNPNIQRELKEALEFSWILSKTESKSTLDSVENLDKKEVELIHYYIENKSSQTNAIDVEFLGSFLGNFLQSFRAYAIQKIRNDNMNDSALIWFSDDRIKSLINPKVEYNKYSSTYISISFEKNLTINNKIMNSCTNLLSEFHKEVMFNPLSENHLDDFLKRYPVDSMIDIILPVVKIKNENDNFIIGVFNEESKEKMPLEDIDFVSKVVINHCINHIEQKPSQNYSRKSIEIAMADEIIKQIYKNHWQILERNFDITKEIGTIPSVSGNFLSLTSIPLGTDRKHLLATSHVLDDSLIDLLRDMSYLNFRDYFRKVRLEFIKDIDKNDFGDLEIEDVEHQPVLGYTKKDKSKKDNKKS